MSRIYLITEAEKDAVLKELELEKFHTPSQFACTPEQRKAQSEAVEDIHRRFHYIVCKLLS
jgi:hypothetical protein